MRGMGRRGAASVGPFGQPELSNEALAGDGRHIGQGWYCFDGDVGGKSVGRCDRDAMHCGLYMAAQRCREQSQAACFQVTRTLKEGPRVFCFPSAPQCDENHGQVAKRTDVTEQTTCQVYR